MEPLERLQVIAGDCFRRKTYLKRIDVNPVVLRRQQAALSDQTQNLQLGPIIKLRFIQLNDWLVSACDSPVRIM